MRDGRNPGQIFDRLAALGLVRLHASSDVVREHIAQERQDGDAVTGSEGLGVGRGDLIQTRKNDTALG